jgi:predicted nucleic acid-binding protein
MGELVDTYSNLPLGGADACVVAMAERLKITEVATLDHRHFTVVRPRHTEALILRP